MFYYRFVSFYTLFKASIEVFIHFGLYHFFFGGYTWISELSTTM